MMDLTDEEVAGLKSSLEKLRDELNEQLDMGQSATGTVQLDQSKVGRLSRMDAIQQQKMAESSLHSTRQRLRRVLQALAKIESGDYGYCDECGEAIFHPRLLVQPETPYCLQCQSGTENPGA